MINYFKGINTIEELKKEYKKLARQLHPDFGGETSDFQEMLNQYEEAMKKGFKETTDKEISNDMWTVIKRFMFNDDVIIELVGSWIWITGNTFPIKDSLKELGAKWSSKHKKWYYAEVEGKKRGTKEKFEEIAKKYGYKKLQGQYVNALA